MSSIAARMSAALQRNADYDEVIALARAGDPARGVRGVRYRDALGRFIALTANLALQHAVGLAGDGIALYQVARERVGAAALVDRALIR